VRDGWGSDPAWHSGLAKAIGLAEAPLEVGLLPGDDPEIDDHQDQGEEKQRPRGVDPQGGAKRYRRVKPRSIGLRVRRYGPVVTRAVTGRQGCG
jgi:hypothetical protein